MYTPLGASLSLQKTCVGCGQSKSIMVYAADRDTPDGRSDKCGDCLATEASRSRVGEQAADDRHSQREQQKATEFGVLFEAYSRTEALGKLGGRCAYCGISDATTIDHIVPPRHGGACSPRNVLPACGPCNSSKGDRPLIDWLATRAEESAPVTTRSVSVAEGDEAAAARALYVSELEKGHRMTGAELASHFERSDRWGRLRIAECRA